MNPKLPTEQVSPTVITDATIREKVIPDIYSRIKKVTPTPFVSDPNSPNPPQNEKEYSSILKTYGLNGTGEDDVENSISSDSSYIQMDELYKRAMGINDKVLASTMEAIKRSTAKKNKAATQGGDALNTALMRSGSARYAPGGAIAARTQYDMDTIEEIQSEEEDAIARANEAYLDKDMELAQNMLNKVDEIRERKLGIAKSINDKIAAENKIIREAELKASRDSAIVDIIKQGVTKPGDILKYLNYDEEGNLIGDFTLDEVDDAVKILIPKPDKIGGGSGNKLTLSEARSQGLPLSLVGYSEDEITKSFLNSNAPEWFEQKAQAEARMSLTGEVLQKLWDEYRSAYEQNEKVEYNFEDGESSYSPKYKESTYEKAVGNNKEKAKNYFTSTYGDSITDEDADSLADAVQTYIDGGMTYAKAIESVIEEVSE